MDLCTKLPDRVLALENTNTSQAVKIATWKERVKKLEKKRRSRTYKLRRLYKGKKIADLDADTEVTLIDETQGINDEDLMFDTGLLNGNEEEQAPASTPIVSPSQLPKAKDKGKAKMVEPEKPSKKKDQITIDEEVARNIKAQLQAELEEEERLSRQRKKKPT
ncbi:hypothetical protein Tco_0558532 [Tanacetum coccineum]